MTTFTEGKYPGEGCTYELPGPAYLSREKVRIAANQTLTAGQILYRTGQAGQITVSRAAKANNAGGTGAMTLAGTPYVSPVKEGVYQVRCIGTSSDGGVFVVEDPEGIEVGQATVGVAYTGPGIAFTIADGSTDFVEGEGFDVTVAVTTFEYAAFDQDVVGSAVPAAICFGNYTTGASGGIGVVWTRMMEFRAGDAKWPADISADEKAAAIDALASNFNIVIR